MKKKKGFTLIELLAVIVILAIIALIATPIVLNIINKAKKSAFQDSAYGLIESAKLYYAESILDGGITSNKEFKFDGSNNELKYNGSSPKGGSLVLTSNGETVLAIHNNVWCATKTRNESQVTLKKYEESTCVLPDDIEVPNTPTYPTLAKKVKEASGTMTNDPDHNTRYVGSNPNNFVLFNNELWRIIGEFNGEVKIIRNEFYSTGIQWGPYDENDDQTYRTGTNDWRLSTLRIELNETYLNSINATYRSMINENHVWNLGGTSLDVPTMTRTNIYNNERGTEVYSENPTEWTGAIGLMYVSDYGYSTSAGNSECDATMVNWDGTGEVENCRNNSWLYNSSKSQWTVSTLTVSAYIFSLTSDGAIRGDDALFRFAASPSLYLKSNVKVTKGDGSETNPFELIL